MQKLHGPRRTERLLWVMEDVGHGVHSYLVVTGINTHSLLSHGTLVDITGTLVMVGEGNNTGADTQNHTGMNFTVSVRRGVRIFRFQILWFHSHHGCLFLLGVNILNEALHEKICPGQALSSWLHATIVSGTICHTQSLQLQNMMTLDAKILIGHNKEWSTDTSSIRVDTHFLLRNVTDNTDFRVNIDHTT